MDNLSQSQDPDPKARGSLRNREDHVPYQAPDDHELSPEVQLAWFELNREQTQRMYIRVMRMGGLVGAIVMPLLLLAMYYFQVNQNEEMALGLPQLHENPGTAAVYWIVIGVFAGFLSGVGLGALGFWVLQRFQ